MRIRDWSSDVCSSDLKALLCHPDLEREFDIQAIEDYFAFGYVPDPKTIYSSVRKLPPAHTLIWQRGAPLPMPQPYWDIRFQSNTRLKEDDARVELPERMSEAVKIRHVADVPLGAFLSGGVASSTNGKASCRERGC